MDGLCVPPPSHRVKPSGGVPSCVPGLSYADALGPPDPISSAGEGWWSGGCREGAVTRAEVSLLCPSRRATSQAPAMSRMLLLVLLLLRGPAAAAGRPPPAATPRLKLAFPGEHGTRAGWGDVGSSTAAPVLCQHPALSWGRGAPWGAGGSMAGGVRPLQCCLTGTGTALPAGIGTGGQVPRLIPDPRATCLPLGPSLPLGLHSRPLACAGAGGCALRCATAAPHAGRGDGAASWPAAPWAPALRGGFVRRQVLAGALLPA